MDIKLLRSFLTMKYFYKLSVLILFLSLLAIVGSTFMLSPVQSSEGWELGVYIGCFVVFACSLNIIYFRQYKSDNLHLEYQQCKLAEEAEAFQLQQKEFQDKLRGLAQKENEINQKILLYQQYVELPDNDDCQEDENQHYFDDEIAQLLHDKAKVIFDKIIEQKYTENEIFSNDLILKDAVDIVESVARIHHPDSKNPLLETSIENLLRSLNRLSLQLLVLVDRFPVNIKEYNLRKTYLYIQKSTRTFAYYKKAEPFLNFATPVFRVGLVVANPVLGLAQTAAMEAGKHVIKKSSEKYALSLLHDVIAIIGEQATTIFGDSSLRYRNKHWIYALELSEIAYYFNPVKPAALNQVFKIISGLPMRSEYDRVFLYHCIAQSKSAHLNSYTNEFMSTDEKQKLARKLSEFIENYIDKERLGENSKKINRWRKEVENRLGIECQLKIDKNESESLKNRLSSGSPEKKIKPFLARYILATLQDEEIPQFIYADIYFDSILPELKKIDLWLIISNRRFLLISVDKKQQCKLLWLYEIQQKKSLLIQRVKRLVADDCRVSGGLWQEGLQTESEPEFILKGRSMGSYERYFRVLEDLK